MNRIVGIGVVFCLLGSVALAQDRKPPGEQKSFGADLKDVNLHDLTIAVQKVTKKTFLWTEELGLRTRRAHFITDVSIVDSPELLFKAYQSILQVSNFILVPVGKPGEEVYKIKLAGTGVREPVKLVKEEMEPEDRFVTRVFSLQFISPRDVQIALMQMVSNAQGGILAIEASGILLVTDYDYNIKRFEEIVKAMDVPKPDVKMLMIPLKNALATDVEQMVNGLVQTLMMRSTQPRPGAPPVPGGMNQESLKVVADKRTNSVLILAEPTRMPQIEDIVRRLDGDAPFETSGVYIYHLQHTNSKEVGETLNKMYGLSTPGGSGGTRPPNPTTPGLPQPPATSPSMAGPRTGSEPIIVPDERSNSLLIVTDRNTYKTLEGIIQRIDRRRPQVLIKATVVEIRANEDFDLGVELARLEDPTGRTIAGGRTGFGLSSVSANAASNTFSITPNPATTGMLLLVMRDRIGNIPALLKAFEGKAKVSILDEPEAATNDNGMALMKVSNQVPILQTQNVGTSGTPVTSFSRFEAAETSLGITPHISQGGYLRLETTVKIEKFTRESTDPSIPPPKTSREITTKEIMVPNGGTMVIGGIVTQDKSRTFSGVPILSHIPLVGLLFSRVQETEEKRTLYIFLTPYILYDHSFGDYRELTQDRKGDIERLRGEALQKLNVDPRSERLPSSTFQYRPARKED